MDFIKELLEEETEDLTGKEESNKLPNATIKGLEKLVKDGCKPNKETGQMEPWSNALHLVHKAYSIANIQRPLPEMKELWAQYEKLIAFAVKQLSDSQGIKGDWRMSSSVFRTKK